MYTNTYRFYDRVVMPAKKGFCWCLGGTAPPEISYGLDNGAMTLKPIEVELPMPEDEKELNAKFAELVDELGLDKPHREAMFNMPAEKKWQIYCSKRKEQEDPASSTYPDYYIERVNTMMCMFFCNDEEEIQNRTKLVESLKTALRTQPMSFVMRFIELEGLDCLLKYLTTMDYTISRSPIHTAIIGCVKALMNNSQGRAHVLAHPLCINTIAQSLSCDNIRTKVAVLEILGAVCLVPGGHKKVLEAMYHYQKYTGERTRFQTVINDLDRSTGEYREEVTLKTTIMSFINAILRGGPGKSHLEFRLHLRYEFLMLGIQPILEKLRRHDNANLDRHLDVFEMLRNEDEKQLGKKFDVSHVDSRSATAMFDLLRKKLTYTGAYCHLQSVLLHLLQLPCATNSPLLSEDSFDGNPSDLEKLGATCPLVPVTSDTSKLQDSGIFSPGPNFHNTRMSDTEREEIRESVGNGLSLQYWQLIDRIVQQICLQTKEGDPDVAPLELDVKKVVKQLANETAMKEVHSKIRDLQKENDELTSRLSKKENECDIKDEEKEELMQTLQKIKAKLEKETASHNEAKVQIAELQTKLSELQQLIDWERGERSKLEYAVKTGSLPDDAKVGVTNMSAALAAAKLSSGPTIAVSGAAPPPPPPPMAPPPPPPPPVGGAPPPPPPSGGNIRGVSPFSSSSIPSKRKNIPQPSQPLKSFNWAKLPEMKIKETVWEDIDESIMFRNLDLVEFEKTFSAYQHQESGSDGDISKTATLKQRELSVIDGRRAQNCTILLSKLKMTNQELARAVLSVDKQEEIPRDMCEQLLKFVPTPEEAQMLAEHEHEIEQMARADRFLFEMSRIDHYEQRLKALYYKKKFSERMSDAKPKVEAVLEASKETSRSRRLRKLLALVLAFGNFMNRGQRGNAYGFRISSLNKIIDTKSSIDKKVTLLHYMAAVIEKTFPDLLKLENEIKHVKLAAKVNLSDLESEIGLLRSGLKDIEKELTYQRKVSAAGTTINHGDRFVAVMADFMAVSAYNFSEMEDQLMEMKQKFNTVVELFGEESKKTQPEEFFGTFDMFLTGFSEAVVDNERFRRMKEEEERRAKMEAQMKAEREKQKNKIGLNKQKGKDGGEFDDLISALRTGDVFGDDIAKLKRTRKRAPPQAQKGIVDANPRERRTVIKAS